MKTHRFSILAVLCTMIFFLSCSKSDNKPVYKKENPLQAYLTATGFTEVTSDVNDGDYEFGISFKPLVKGNITDIIVKLPDNQTNLRVTIWDATTGAILRTETIAAATTDVETTKSITPLALTKDKEYMITFNSNDWYNRVRSDAGNVAYPIKAGNSPITGYGYTDGTGQTYPDSFEVSYYAGDLSFNFIQTN